METKPRKEKRAEHNSPIELLQQFILKPQMPDYIICNESKEKEVIEYLNKYTL